MGDFDLVNAKAENIEKAIDAQHYIAISRMLDISFSVLTALYFACESEAEAFPFSDETFDEIVDHLNLLDEPVKIDLTYEISKFRKEIQKKFPLFIIEKSKVDKPIEKINYIQNFTFNKFNNEANSIFDCAVNAFVVGDETLFTKEINQSKFLIRPNVADAEDSFEFTNGDYIAKRAFWAYEATVKELMNMFQENQQNIMI